MNNRQLMLDRMKVRNYQPAVRVFERKKHDGKTRTVERYARGEYVSPHQMREWSAQRRRARQTHPGKRRGKIG